ncbi:MAG TPA: HAD family hydrolase [Pyrinomonadaceae bacterium]|nr:HAD family hydrolase [Pyrinomonadaceae bacterium]
MKAVLFDLDGTLLDSFALHYLAYETMFGHFGIEMSRELFLSTYSPNWYRTYEAFGLHQEHWERANTLWLEAAAVHKPELFPAVEEMLAELGSIYELGIVTSGSKSRVVNDLDRLSIAGHFSTVITGDDIANPKPAPDALELALRYLSVAAADAVYVGDAHADFEMSRAAGVRFIGVASEFANLLEDHPEYDLHPISSLPRVIESLV